MGRIKTWTIRLVAVVIVLGLSRLVQAAPGGPIWTQLGPTGGPPGQRLLPTAGYDAATNRMIVFGGANQDFGSLNYRNYNDVWVLTNADGLGGAPAWTPLAPSGTPPAARFGAGGGYDPGSNRLIIFGGAIVDYPAVTGACTWPVNAGTANDVWILTNANGSGGAPAWTPLIRAGVPPSPRRAGVVVYDAANNRLILFGGNEACAKRNDVWILSNANGLGAGTPTWTQLTPSGTPPAARGDLGFGGAYDAGTNRLIIVGGGGDLSAFNDVWVLANANGLGGTPTWTQLSPAGGPPPARLAHTVTYDAAANSLTVIGGVDHSETSFFSDVWRLTNANGLGGPPGWTRLAPGAGPLPRAGHSAVYHQATKRTTIFAGVRCAPCAALNDTWVLADVVPFAAFSAAVQINQASSSFHATGGLTPGLGGSIDPLTQALTFQVGGFTTTIPAGSFRKNNGAFTFAGSINGVPLDVTIQPQGGGYAYRVDAAGAPHLPTGNPVMVSLTIGYNTGTIQVNATFN
jgi:hypothetical protein